MAHIANGRDPGNCVSLLRVNVSFKRFLLKSSIRVTTFLEHISESRTQQCFTFTDVV